LLARDATQGSTDHLDELWAKPLPPLPAEGGLIAVAVRDAQGRFNLNNLVRGGAPSAPDITVFRRLLNAADLNPALTEAVLDWLDPDSETRAGGADDIDYVNLPQPYRAANQPIASVDELRLIKGFDAASVDKLRPYLVALPEPTAVNVNTAEPAVLAALFPDMTVATLQPFLDRRQRQPLTQPTELTATLPAGTPPPQVQTSVTTGYFLVTIEIRLGRLQQRSEALIQRPTGGRAATLVWQRRLWPQPSREQDDKDA
jgi:general secretion pathway protein K